MKREITATNIHDSEILLEVLKLIKNNEGSMRYADIKSELPNVYDLSDKDREAKKTWKESWHSILGMIGGIELKQVGIVDIKSGIWSITPKGERLLDYTPEQFYTAYHFPYLELARLKKLQNLDSLSKIQNPEVEREVEFESDIESLQSKARERLSQFIFNKNPYQFQNLVSSLLRGMGYFTSFVAPKGKDGGIDIVAYQDPFGAKGGHIKVQVKHQPSSALTVDVVRSLSGILSNPDDIGIIITSGRFTKDCNFEARRSHKSLRLIDLDEFIDLWLLYYPNMTDKDKAELPIKPVYYLDSDKI